MVLIMHFILIVWQIFKIFKGFPLRGSCHEVTDEVDFYFSAGIYVAKGNDVTFCLKK